MATLIRQNFCRILLNERRNLCDIKRIVPLNCRKFKGISFDIAFPNRSGDVLFNVCGIDKLIIPLDNHNNLIPIQLNLLFSDS
mgnify:FL=1